jgi:hypothetical protein
LKIEKSQKLHTLITATRLHDTCRHIFWISLVLFGIALSLLTLCVYLHYGKDDLFYQDSKLILSLGLLIYLGICVRAPVYIKQILARIKKIEEDIDVLKNIRN